jgi:predicted Zn finger-like uncharacterized protein
MSKIPPIGDKVMESWGMKYEVNSFGINEKQNKRINIVIRSEKMRVECPTCSKVYNVPDERLTYGKKIAFRCPACKGTFKLDLRSINDILEKNKQDLSASVGKFFSHKIWPIIQCNNVMLLIYKFSLFLNPVLRRCDPLKVPLKTVICP